MSAPSPIQHSTLNIQHSRLLFILLALVALLLFAKPLLTNQVPIFRDHFDYFQPLRWFTADELRHGRLPLWNAYNASGEPWLANPQTGVFYPPAWLFLLLPFAASYTLFLALHVMLLGWSGYLLFSRFASTVPALVGALALMLCGPTLSLVDVNNNLATFAWVPLVLWCAVANVSAQGSAAAIAMSFLAGEPFFAALAALAFAVLRWRDALFVGLASIGLCAVQLFPFVAAIRETDRSSFVPPAELLRDSMPLRDWLALVWPAPMTTSEQFIPVVYVGALTFAFAVFGLAFRGARRVPLVCAAVIVACVVVAAGVYFSPTAALLTHLPVALLRYPARVVPLAALAVCTLAAIGVERAIPRRWRLPLAALMCADLLLRVLPLLACAPFDPHPVPYARGVGRDAKLIRFGFGTAHRLDRPAWIAGYLNLYDRRFDVWTAAPFVSQPYTRAYEAALRDGTGALSAMSCGWVLAERDGRVTVMRNAAALPMAYVRAADGRIAPVSWMAFTTSSLFIGIDAPFDGTLVVTQQDAPGWRAEIDGRSTPTTREGVFRSVRVSAGHHEVTWRYRPRAFIIGACVTFIALARLLLSTIFVKSVRHEKFFRASVKIAWQLSTTRE